jgi:hypothetical protein
LTEITAEAERPPANGPSRQLRVARRYLVGISAAGAAAGLILTGATTGSAATASGASGTSASRVITLTSRTSSSAGHLTVLFKYEPGKRGAIKALSLTYSGGSPLKFAHPALVFALRPGPGPANGKPVQVKSHPLAFTLILKIPDVRHFSGTLPVKDLPRISWKVRKSSRRPLTLPSILLEASVASVSMKRPTSISVPVGLQVGILLGPIGF